MTGKGIAGGWGGRSRMVFIPHLVQIVVAFVWLGNFLLDFEVPSPKDNILLKYIYVCMYAVSILSLYVNLNMYIHMHS